MLASELLLLPIPGQRVDDDCRRPLATTIRPPERLRLGGPAACHPGGSTPA